MFSASIADIARWSARFVWSRRWEPQSLRAAISSHLGREVADKEAIPLAVWAEEGHHMEDYEIRWILACIPGGPAAIVSFAADCAEMVLPLWGPHDTRPAACIAAVRAWLVDPTPERLRDVRRAGRGAYDAARAADPLAAFGPATDPGVLAGYAAWQAAVEATDAAAGYRNSGSCPAAAGACEAFRNQYMDTQPYWLASAGVEMQARQRARLLQYLQDEPLPPLPALPTRDEIEARATVWRAADAARAAAREARAVADGWGAQP